MPLEPGRRLGLSQVISPLGAGGMGEVYRAMCLGRDVALKVLPEAVATRASSARPRAPAALSHPGIHEVEESNGVRFHQSAPTETLD